MAIRFYMYITENNYWMHVEINKFVVGCIYEVKKNRYSKIGAYRGNHILHNTPSVVRLVDTVALMSNIKNKYLVLCNLLDTLIDNVDIYIEHIPKDDYHQARQALLNLKAYVKVHKSLFEGSWRIMHNDIIYDFISELEFNKSVFYLLKDDSGKKIVLPSNCGVHYKI